MTVEQLEEVLIGLVRAKVLSIKEPHTAEQIALANPKDKFILYFSRVADSVIVEKSLNILNSPPVPDAFWEFFNKYSDEIAKRGNWHVPVIEKALAGLYETLSTQVLAT